MRASPTEILRPPAAVAEQERPASRGRLRALLAPDRLTVLGVGSALLAVGLAGGGYGIQARNTLSIAVWLAVAFAAVVGGVARAATRGVLLAGGLLAAFAVVTAGSLLWAASNERAWDEVTRVLLYLGVFALVALLAPRTRLAAWCDGLATGITAIALVALASRLFPDLFPEARPLEFLAGTQTRLSYPLGYWTGLGILIALGFPLLLRTATAAAGRVSRGAAVAALPLLGVALYLTSARVGVLIAVIATALLVFLQPRWRMAGALAIAVPATAVAIAIVASQDAVVDGMRTDAAVEGGRLVAVLLVLVAAAAGAAYALLSARVPTPRPLSRRGRRYIYAWIVVAIAFTVAASNPAAQAEQFTQNPAGLNQRGIDAHLTSLSSNGRWQLWNAAVDAARTEPLHGRGAGSFEAWWSQHGSLAAFSRNAHSVFLEAAADLGIIGFLLVVGVAVAGVAVFAASLRRRDSDRLAVAAIGSAFVGYLIGAGMDWMWQLTVVSLVGIAALALLASGWSRPNGGEAREARSRPLRAALVAAAVVAVAASAIPLFRAIALERSASAAERNDLAGATDAALTAVAVQPWAASPYLQVALLRERAGHLGSADVWIRRAIRRDPEDWRLWLTRARIDAERREIRLARRHLGVARRLNPRSPLFADGR